MDTLRLGEVWSTLSKRPYERHDSPRPQRRPEGRQPHRRASAPAAHRRRPDAERARGPALLEGVREPDRAGQDASDPGDDRLAGRPAGRGCGLPGERRVLRRAWARRGFARPGRRPDACPPRRRGAPRVRDHRPRRTLDRLGRARGAGALGRGLGAAARRRRPAGARAARTRARARRGARLLGHGPRRGAVPHRRVPIQASERLDRARALQRGDVARAALRAPERSPEARRSSAGAPAATAASATSRLRARTSRPRSSCRRASRTAAASRTRTSRLRSSPSGSATSSRRAPTRSARRRCTRRSRTRCTWAAC